VNKELILDNKECFEHWLAGGQLLYTYPAIQGWQQCKGDHNWAIGHNTYIIKDRYVEFRKALAEGKTIQYNPNTQMHNRWDNIIPDEGTFTEDTKNYRIKPDEPEFKVGDHVVMLRNNNIMRLSEKDILGFGALPSRLEEIKLWTPSPGDYVWAWGDNKVPRLILLLEHTINGVGTLPSGLSSD